MEKLHFETLEIGNNKKVKIEYNFLEGYMMEEGYENLDELFDNYTYDEAKHIERLYLKSLKSEINNHTSKLHDDLLTIKVNKEIELIELGKEDNGIDTIGYAILNEEIEDVKYAIDSLSIKDEIERNSRLKGVLNQTTSNTIYDTLKNSLEVLK